MKKWFIPGNVPSSKNSRQWTGKYFIASKSTQQYRKQTECYWTEYKEEFLLEAAKHEAPYVIAFEFIRGTKHKFDYVNPLQTIQDEMVKYEWIEDDNADILIPVLLPYKYDKTSPGVIIYFLNDEKTK
jgi:hypothetical protein